MGEEGNDSRKDLKTSEHAFMAQKKINWIPPTINENWPTPPHIMKFYNTEDKEMKLFTYIGSGTRMVLDWTAILETEYNENTDYKSKKQCHLYWWSYLRL